MDEQITGGLPLGVLRQACMKIDSAINDLNECKEDDDVDEPTKETFSTLCEELCNIEAHIVNIVSRELNEDEFLAEQIPMDDIEPVPGETDDLLDEEI